MAIPVVWLQYEEGTINRGYWDQGMLEDIFANKMWITGYEFSHHDSVEGLKGAVIVFPARNQVQFLNRLQEDINKLKWVILMLTGDEEAVFPVEQIKHPNIRIWVMSPRKNRHDKYSRLGSGYPPQMRELMPKSAPEKNLDWFFAGQVTHQRRELCLGQLERLPNGEAHPSEGFTRGLDPSVYYQKLASAKVAPCPSGPETPDSFRLFEALEAGCVPIADPLVGRGGSPEDYWTWFFLNDINESHNFPVVTDYAELPWLITRAVEKYPTINNQVFAWWQLKKREMVEKLRKQIQEVSKIEPKLDPITVLMPSSPTRRHPSMDHIEQTIADVRVHLPNAEIIIMLDGVREEQERLRDNYEEYQRQLLWKCNYEWTNVLPLRFEKFGHQSTMTRRALCLVRTPLVLFVEHDTPLTPDMPIPFDKLGETIIAGDANVIRLYPEKIIIPGHEDLFIGKVEDVGGVPLLRTCQWSQRPHLTSAAWYRHVIEAYFREEATAFIEHGLYGPVVEAYLNDGLLGWNLWKLWMYAPEGNIQRSYDLNSRGEEPNYESIF